MRNWPSLFGYFFCRRRIRRFDRRQRYGFGATKLITRIYTGTLYALKMKKLPQGVETINILLVK